MKFPFGKNKKDETNPSVPGTNEPEKIGGLDLDDDLDREFHELGQEEELSEKAAPEENDASVEEGASVEEAAPVEDSASVEEDPVEDSTPVEDVPVEDSIPAEEAPAEDSIPVEDSASAEDSAPAEEEVPVEDVPAEPLSPKERKKLEKENLKKAKRKEKWEKKKLRRQRQTIKPILYGIFLPLFLIIPAIGIAFASCSFLMNFVGGTFEFTALLSMVYSVLLAIFSLLFMRHVRRTNKFDENFRFGISHRGLLMGLIFGSPILVAAAVFILVNNVFLGGGYDLSKAGLIYALVMGITVALFHEIVLIGVVFTNMVSGWRLRKHTVLLATFWTGLIYALYIPLSSPDMALSAGIFNAVFFFAMGVLCSAVYLRKRNLLSLIILETVFWFFMAWIKRPDVVEVSKPWDYIAIGAMSALFLLVSYLLLGSWVREQALQEFLAPVGIPDLATRRKNRPRGFRLVLHVIGSLLGLAVLGIILCPVVIRFAEPRAFLNFFVETAQDDIKGKKITGSSRIVSRNDVLSKAAIENVEQYGMFRDLYYQDKADAKSNVVFVYMIGSNLESGFGSGSLNISQMMEATKGNPSLKFVLEAGGAKFWAYEPFMNGKVGRYEIADGKVKKVQNLGKKICMTDAKPLKEFLKWGAKNYKADRYMLVLWDHGGGAGAGFGHDDVNEANEKHPSITQVDVAQAMDKSGLKYDLVGFDACLMQTMEWAYALEPYADYYLASEELEPGYGWYWTEGFKALGKEPGLDTRELGRILISSYDELYEGDPGEQTLSLVDLRQIPSVYEKVGALLETQDQRLQTDANVFVEFYNNVSASKGYAESVGGVDEIDLVDFLEKSNYENKDKLIECVQSAVLYHNKKGGEGSNGLAIYAPHVRVDAFSDAREAMAGTACTRPLGLYSDLMSMVVYQNSERKSDKYMKFTPYETKEDYTKESWYNAAIADQDPGVSIDHISLTEVGGSYRIGLSDDQWETITDVMTGLYLHRDRKGKELIDLGNDNRWTGSEGGRPTIGFKGNWVCLNGRPVALTSDTPKKTEDGIVFSGSTTAVLNGVTDIRIFFTWDPISEEDLAAGKEPKGHVLGYLPVEKTDSGLEIKGYMRFEPMDRILLTYDCYKKDGTFIKTRSLYAPIINISQDWLHVGYRKVTRKGARVYALLQNSAGQFLRTDSVEYKK